MTNVIMHRLTVRLPDDMADRIADLAGENGPYESKSEAVRELIRQGEQLPEVQQERDRLRDQLAATNSRADDIGELVTYVKQERALRERDRDRQQAPVWQRAKWWLFGEPAEPDR